MVVYRPIDSFRSNLVLARIACVIGRCCAAEVRTSTSCGINNIKLNFVSTAVLASRSHSGRRSKDVRMKLKRSEALRWDTGSAAEYWEVGLEMLGPKTLARASQTATEGVVCERVSTKRSLARTSTKAAAVSRAQRI